VAASWHDLYETHVVGVYLLLIVPVLFLGLLVVHGIDRSGGVEPYAARFVRAWSLVFALASIVDPIATGLFAIPFVPFVLLGDFRVFALALVVMQPGRARAGALLEALAWMLLVTGVAYATFHAVNAIHGPVPGQVLWLVYEVAFAVLAVFWMVLIVPSRVGVERGAVRRYLRSVFAFVLLYYVLWATADVLILTGRDAGWGLRVVPNVLYYGAFVPAAYWRFFAAASSRSTHASR
jgi:hypothetical protein